MENQLFKKSTPFAAVAVMAAVSLSACGSNVDFGNNSSQWANDGECDDPRFEGNGMATVLVEADRGRDAADCEALFEAGRIQLRDGER